VNVLRVHARAVWVLVKRPPRSASGDIPLAPLVRVDLETDDSGVGHAYLFAFTSAMLAPTVGCV
jgi:mandelate racemase